MKSLSKKAKYIVACSYGPDSMALLNMLIEKKYNVVVAHVNYHKRDASNFEEESLRKFCANKNIEIEVLDTTNLVCDKNFQEWARDIRYEFFKKVADKYNAQAVLVAHQQDDLIETFLMQKDRGGIVKYWGIAEETTIKGVKIIRPLLDYSKQDLLDYDVQNNVPYSIDESNLKDDYLRNQIRHTIVEKLSKEDRQIIISQIQDLNTKTTRGFKTTWKVDEFLKLSYEDIVFSISSFLDKYDLHKDLSKSFVDEIKKAISSKKAFVEIVLVNNVVLTKDYENVLLLNKFEFSKYCFEIQPSTLLDNELFTIYFDKNNLDRNVSLDDFPLTIKPVKKNETIKVSNYEVEVRRLFIDWKLPHYLRDKWPGIYNKDGKLIYIPRYREEFVDNHSSKFVIKFVKFD